MYRHLKTVHKVDVLRAIIVGATFVNANEDGITFIDVGKSKYPGFTIWSFFRKLSATLVQCNLCSKHFRRSINSTGALYRHIRHAHSLAVVNNKTSTSSVAKESDGIIFVDVSKKKDPGFTIWSYFKKLSATLVECNLCSNHLHRSKNSTGALYRHIRHVHSLDVLNKKNSSSSSSIVRDSGGKVLLDIIPTKAFRRSVWSYFKKVSSNRAQCNLCHRSLIGNEKSTGNLYRHIRITHSNDVVGSIPKSAGQFDDKVKGTSNLWQYFKRVSSMIARCHLCKKLIFHADKAQTKLTNHLESLHKTVWRHDKALSTSSGLEIDYTAADAGKVVVDVTTTKKKTFCKSIWSYFKEISDTRVQCNLCLRNLVRNRTSTGNLYRHMKTVHHDNLVGSVEEFEFINTLSKESTELDKKEEENEWVWQLFETEDDKIYKCLICNYEYTKLSDEDESYKSVLEHLQLEHGLESSEQLVIEDETKIAN